MRPAAGFVLCVVLAGVAIACGKKGPPRAPEPRGPLPPREVEARQEGSDVRVWFSVPSPRGTKPSQVPARAELVRVEYPPDSNPPQDPDAFRRRGRVVSTHDVQGAPGSLASLGDATLRVLPKGGKGWILRYGIRVWDHGGRLSPLVVAQDLVPVEPPEPPSHLQAEATADGIRLKWEPPERVDSLLYNVYRESPGQRLEIRPVNREPLQATEFLDAEVTSGNTYAYSVRTAASGGPPYRESVSSERVVLLAEDRFPPAAPERLVAVQEGPAVRLLWNPNQERDLAGYRVYRKAAENWVQVGPDLVDRPSYLDADVQPGQRLEYRVTALDRASRTNESAPSEVVQVEVAAEPSAVGDHP